MRDTRKCVAGWEVGGCLDRNFSRAERPLVWGMLVYTEVKSRIMNIMNVSFVQSSAIITTPDDAQNQAKQTSIIIT